MATTKVDSEELRRLRTVSERYQVQCDRLESMFYLIAGVHMFFSKVMKLTGPTANAGSTAGVPVVNNGWKFDYGIVEVCVYPLSTELVIVDPSGRVDPFRRFLDLNKLTSDDQERIAGYLARVVRARSVGSDVMAEDFPLVSKPS